MSKTNEEWSAKDKAGVGAVDYRKACLRLPRFPLQLLLRQRPDWRDKKAVWLERLHPDAPVRYASAQARQLGLNEGVRYATALGLIPDLLAGSHTPEELRREERSLLALLRRFTPALFRPNLASGPGTYLLDATGLGRAFGGMEQWARQLLKALAEQGWQPLLALGFSPFATEMATYTLSFEHPLRMFEDRLQEERAVCDLPLQLFGLSPGVLERLHRFGIRSLEDLLALDFDELSQRFEDSVLQLYQRASEAILSQLEPILEQHPVAAQTGFPHPVEDLQVLLAVIEGLLLRLLPRVAAREEGVSQMVVALHTEEPAQHERRGGESSGAIPGKRRVECIRPSFPTLDSRWLMQLIKARLESHLGRQPLAWGRRVERVILALGTEGDTEEQLELFSGWALERALSADPGQGSATLWRPRDKQALLRSLAWVRAEFGDSVLVRAQLKDSHLPGRDVGWQAFSEKVLGQPPRPSEQDCAVRVRRRLSRPVRWPRVSEEVQEWGPYRLDGGWWDRSYCREYSYRPYGRQLAWLYREPGAPQAYIEGWLQ